MRYPINIRKTSLTSIYMKSNTQSGYRGIPNTKVVFSLKMQEISYREMTTTSVSCYEKFIQEAMNSALQFLKDSHIPRAFSDQIDHFESLCRHGDIVRLNDQVVTEDGQMLWIIITNDLVRDADDINERVFAPKLEIIARFRVSPESAAKFKHGAIVKDSKGLEYLALSARYHTLTVAPIVDGKPQVSSDTCFKFNLRPDLVDMYPSYRSDPIFVVFDGNDNGL